MEISRLQILQRLVERFEYHSYLEIGLASGAVFKHLDIARKTGVDPKWRRWYAFDRRVERTTSDRFFARDRRHFDLVFIDGLHIAEQAWRDIRHSLAVLEEGGTIVVHDCSPRSEAEQAVPRIQQQWTGDVWRAFLKASQDPALDTLLLDTDRGCGLVRRQTRPASAPWPPSDLDPLDPEQISWELYQERRHLWLRIVPAAETLAAVEALAAVTPSLEPPPVSL